MSAPSEGTVLRFTVEFPDAPDAYTYAAIFAGGMWYTTSRFSSPLENGSVLHPKMNQAALEAVLQSPQVADVSVAAEWEAL